VPVILCGTGLILFLMTAYALGWLNLLLPSETVTRIWMLVTIVASLTMLIGQSLPYQFLVDREVMVGLKILKRLSSGKTEDFAALLRESTYSDAERRTTLFGLMMRVRRMVSNREVATSVDISFELEQLANWHELRLRPQLRRTTFLLTLGILGTYVGVIAAVRGAETLDINDTESIWRFVSAMLSYIGLAVLSTLIALFMGSVILNFVSDRAEQTVHTLLHHLHEEMRASGFADWVGDTRTDDAAKLLAHRQNVVIGLLDDPPDA
jgi:hypothetical protein